MDLITKEEAVLVAGEQLVQQALRINCVPTCRVTDGTESAGYDEYRAEAENNTHMVKVFYYQDTVETRFMELDSMTWDIAGYQVEEI